jgi:hypothetical protein
MSGAADGAGHAGVGAPKPGVPGILDAEGVVFLSPGDDGDRAVPRRSAGPRRGPDPDGRVRRLPLGPARPRRRLDAAGPDRHGPRGGGLGRVRRTEPRHERTARRGLRGPRVDRAVRPMRLVPARRGLAVPQPGGVRPPAAVRRRPDPPPGRVGARRVLRDRHARLGPGRRRGRGHPGGPADGSGRRRPDRLRDHDRRRGGDPHGPRPPRRVGRGDRPGRRGAGRRARRPARRRPQDRGDRPPCREARPRDRARRNSTRSLRPPARPRRRRPCVRCSPTAARSAPRMASTTRSRRPGPCRASRPP